MAMNLNLNGGDNEPVSSFTDVAIDEKEAPKQPKASKSPLNIKSPDSSKSGNRTNKILLIALCAGGGILLLLILTVLLFLPSDSDDGGQAADQTSISVESPENGSEGGGTDQSTVSGNTDVTAETSASEQKITYNQNAVVKATQCNQPAGYEYISNEPIEGIEDNKPSNSGDDTQKTDTDKTITDTTSGKMTVNLEYNTEEDGSISFVFLTDQLGGESFLVKITDNDGYYDVCSGITSKDGRLSTTSFYSADGEALIGSYSLYLCESDGSLIKSWNIIANDDGKCEIKNGISAADLDEVRCLDIKNMKYHNADCPAFLSVDFKFKEYSVATDSQLYDLGYEAHDCVDDVNVIETNEPDESMISDDPTI